MRLIPVYRSDPGNAHKPGNVRVVAFATIDDEDYDLVSGFRWFLHSGGYVSRRMNGRTTYLHRFITGAAIGEEVDHRDLDRLNNTRGNMRPCTRSQNLCNRGLPRNSTTGQKCISVDRRRVGGRFRVVVKRHGKVSERRADTLEAAIAMRDLIIDELHGEFARI